MSTTRQPPLSCFDLPHSQCEHLDKCCLRRGDEHIKLWHRSGLEPFQPLHAAAAIHLRRGNWCYCATGRTRSTPSRER